MKPIVLISTAVVAVLISQTNMSDRTGDEDPEFVDEYGKSEWKLDTSDEKMLKPTHTEASNTDFQRSGTNDRPKPPITSNRPRPPGRRPGTYKPYRPPLPVADAEEPIVYCGKQHKDYPVGVGVGKRMAGGTFAKAHSWPWMTRLYVRNGDGTLEHVCGGVLLLIFNDTQEIEVFLTAAHCFMENDELIKRKKFVVKVGHHSEIDIPRVEFDAGLTRTIAKIELYPDYLNPDKPENWAADLGLGLFNESVPFGPTIRPICLPDKNHNLDHLLAKTCYVTGWGKISESGKVLDISATLKQTRAYVKNEGYCLHEAKHFWHLPYIRRKTICALHETGSSPLKGDSGGPLQCLDKTKNGEIWTLYGILSGNIEYTTTGDAAVHLSSRYVRVNYYSNSIHWIVPMSKILIKNGRRSQTVQLAVPKVPQGKGPTITDEFKYRPKGNPRTVNCGQPHENYPVREDLDGTGIKAAPHSYPWAVQILRKDNDGKYQVYCTGILVRIRADLQESDVVLTAAECISDDGTNSNPTNEYVIRVGHHTVNIARKDPTVMKSLARQAREFFLYQEYSIFSKLDDISFIRIESVPFGPTVYPLCLPDDDDDYELLPTQMPCKVTGWGRQSGVYNVGQENAVLLEINAKVQGDRFCQDQKYPIRGISRPKYDDSKSICAVYESKNGIQGPIPCLYKDPRGHEYWTLYGIVSTVQEKHWPMQNIPPTLYARVSYYNQKIGIRNAVRAMSKITRKRSLPAGAIGGPITSVWT